MRVLLLFFAAFKRKNLVIQYAVIMNNLYKNMIHTCCKFYLNKLLSKQLDKLKINLEPHAIILRLIETPFGKLFSFFRSCSYIDRK